MINARIRVCGLNSDQDANTLLWMLVKARDQEIQYLQSISHEHPEDGHRKWKVPRLKNNSSSLLREEYQKVG